MGEVLVDNNSLDKEGILESSSDLSINLDQLEIDISPVDICDRENGVYRNLGKLRTGF